MTRFSALAAIAALTVHGALLGAQTGGELVVHEWGTITTRHAPAGTPEGRLNRVGQGDLLPAFVHRYEPPATQGRPDRTVAKAVVTPGRPDVTMRLETPVLYFHPPAGARRVPPFDVKVSLRGGVLNEFYPAAKASVAVDVDRIRTKMQAGLLEGWDGNVLNNYVVGTLQWSGLSLRDSVRVPSTTSHVWLAPRAVRSAGVAAPMGEGERYLFYRGVAHLDALVQTELLPSEVVLRAPQRLIWMPVPAMTISHLWLADIGAGGHAAFRESKGLTIAKDAESREVGRLPRLTAADYSASGVADLRRSMKQALVSAGLFDDEAEAMLATWRDSYFGTPGLRLFYLVPQEWTSYFLPLEISAPHRLTRVLVGRIELET